MVSFLLRTKKGSKIYFAVALSTKMHKKFRIGKVTLNPGHHTQEEGELHEKALLNLLLGHKSTVTSNHLSIQVLEVTITKSQFPPSRIRGLACSTDSKESFHAPVFVRSTEKNLRSGHHSSINFFLVVLQVNLRPIR